MAPLPQKGLNWPKTFEVAPKSLPSALPGVRQVLYSPTEEKNGGKSLWATFECNKRLISLLPLNFPDSDPIFRKLLKITAIK